MKEWYDNGKLHRCDGPILNLPPIVNKELPPEEPQKEYCFQCLINDPKTLNKEHLKNSICLCEYPDECLNEKELLEKLNCHLKRLLKFKESLTSD